MQYRFSFSSWATFLTLLFALLGTGLFSSGVISWIAANWDYFSNLEKLYATQGLLISLIGLGIGLSRRKGTTINVAFLWFGAAVSIGGLFALIGQIYQTGADPWQLFAIWTLLQLPLCFALPNVANLLLLCVTANLTFFTYFNTHFYSNQAAQFTFFLNVLLFILTYRFSSRFYDPWQIVCRTIAIIGVLCALYSGLLSRHDWLPVLCILAAGFWFFASQRFDIFYYVLFFIGMVVQINVMIISSALSEDGIYVVSLITLSALIFLGYKLNEWAKHVSQQAQSVMVIGLYLFLAIFGMVCLFTVFGFLFELDIKNLLYLSFACFGLSVYFKQTNHSFMLMMAPIFALCLLVIYMYISYDEQNTFLLFGILIYLAAIYYITDTVWVNAFTVAVTLDLLARFHVLFIEYAIIPLWVITFALLYYLPKLPHKLSPIAWGLWLYLLLQLDYSGVLLFFYTDTIAEPLPDIRSFADFFNIISHHAFSSEHSLLERVWRLVIALTPTLLFVCLSRQYRLEKPTFGLLASLFFGIAFIGNIWLIFLFSSLLLTFHLKSRLLWGSAILFLIISLGIYYYWLAIPLLYKSFLLISCGLLFGCVSLLYHRQQPKTPDNATPPNLPKGKYLHWAGLLCLLTTLAIANQTIIQNEHILRDGKTIVLKLAPVDPRSLMQGDYMALNYAILQQVYAQEPLDEEPSHLYALLSLDFDGVAQLCRLERMPPHDFSGCEPDIYLPLRQHHGEFKLPSHEFFFSEGKGEHYAQAEYGEYRFKNGKLLLSRLLNAKHQPL